MNKIIILLLAAFALTGCSQKEEQPEITADDYHNAVDRITDIMVHDIFSPPVASRIYAYTNIAAYEIIAQDHKKFNSFSGEFQDLPSIPKPDPEKEINTRMAALVAHLEIGKHLIFSEADIQVYQDSLYGKWRDKNEDLFTNSRNYGMQVAEHIKTWLSTDNYKETRTQPKYSVYSDDPSRWKPTPPTYMDGIEPHWGEIRTFSLDSASQFEFGQHPQFSLEPSSEFYQELMEVYDIKKDLELVGESSEKLKIAQFWDCNPYVSTQRGHLMFATKKITPGGHWIGVCKIASKKSNLDFEETVYAYTATSIALADGFISCWKEKYRYELIRPETLIHQYVDENWTPVLQTPPFPEYPSGHSVVSGAAAKVLTQLFGDNFSYEDDTEVTYGLPVRSFTSFEQAAEEAALSRLYGGIHYRAAIEDGLILGRKLGSHVVEDLGIKPLVDQDLAAINE